MHEENEPVWRRQSRLMSRTLLSDSVRRAVADLNRRFIWRILRTADDDPDDFRMPALQLLPAAAFDQQTIDVMSACPFTLFELRIPESQPAGMSREHAQVRDAVRPPAAMPDLEYQALAHGALMFASRLADTSPLSLRLALGLSAASELVMNETPVTTLPEWIRSRELLRTRWLEHPHFWPTLVRGAWQRDDATLNRVHCLGLTLLVGDLGLRDADCALARSGPARQRR
jgi:hypothetical protein